MSLGVKYRMKAKDAYVVYECTLSVMATKTETDNVLYLDMILLPSTRHVEL